MSRITLRQAMHDLKFIAENITKKQWLTLTTQIEQIREFLNQQEMLLVHYKQLNVFYEKLYTMELSELSLNSNYYEIEIIKLKQRIKELENE